MARAALAYSAFVPNNSLADPAGTASTSGVGNGFQIPSVPTPPAMVKSLPELTLLRVVGTNAGNVTVKAGTQPLAIASGQGDLTVAVGLGNTVWVGPFESGRFEQSDGSMIVETSVVMTVTAFQFKRNT